MAKKTQNPSIPQLYSGFVCFASGTHCRTQLPKPITRNGFINQPGLKSLKFLCLFQSIYQTFLTDLAAQNLTGYRQHYSDQYNPNENDESSKAGIRRAGGFPLQLSHAVSVVKAGRSTKERKNNHQHQAKLGVVEMVRKSQHIQSPSMYLTLHMSTDITIVS